MFNLKELLKTMEAWRKFKFSVEFTKSGARVYVGDRRTNYFVKGYGYDKTSALIGRMVNDLIGEQEYNKEVYGNDGMLLSEGGVGVDSIIASLKTIDVKLKHIYSGKTYDVFEIDLSKVNFNKRLEELLKEVGVSKAKGEKQ